EPYAGKLARTVLRGRRRSNASSLPDFSMTTLRASWAGGQGVQVGIDWPEIVRLQSGIEAARGFDAPPAH
ncbi:hypothetical protein ACGTRS_31880, partial [Burkholderia semiarida]